MDQYLHAAVASLRLADQALIGRLAHCKRRPNGMTDYYKQINHTTAMLVLVAELRNIAEHRGETWKDDPDEVPF